MKIQFKQCRINKSNNVIKVIEDYLVAKNSKQYFQARRVVSLESVRDLICSSPARSRR